MLMAATGQTKRAHNSVTRLETRKAEARLSEMGYWTGPADGVFDPASRAALIAFQKWEGRPVTGKLTIEEIEAIYRASEMNESWPRAREAGYAHAEVDLDRQVMLIVDDTSVEEVLDKIGDRSAHSKVRVLPVSTGNGKLFIEDGQESVAYTPRGRFLVYDKTVGWETGALGSMYYSNYISGGVAIHGHPNVPNEPASHGCIRIPMFAAREVSKLLTVGTIVLVYDKVSFVSAKEWVDNPELKRAAMLDSVVPDYKYQAQRKKLRTRVTRAE